MEMTILMALQTHEAQADGQMLRPRPTGRSPKKDLLGCSLHRHRFAVPHTVYRELDRFCSSRNTLELRLPRVKTGYPRGYPWVGPAQRPKNEEPSDSISRNLKTSLTGKHVWLTRKVALSYWAE